MLLILFTALVCLGVIHFSALLMMLRSLLVMIKPFLTGACIAFVVNLPLKFLEEKALSRLPEKAEKLKRPLSIFLSFLFIFAVVILLF